MAQMVDIKRRIKSINSTKQITNAMHLVASAKLKGAVERVHSTRPYTDTIVESINRVLATAKGVEHPFLQKREVSRSAYIIISSDRGLAGGFSSNILRMAEKDIEDKSTVEIYSYGLKTTEFFRRKGYSIEKDVRGITEDPDYVDVRDIGNTIIKKYIDGEIDEVKIFYTRFVSMLVQKPAVMTLLPAEASKEEFIEDDSMTLTEYDPSPEEVLDYLIPKYVNGAIYGALIESAASQQGARMIAMESATENAEEILESLDLLYNRARQAAITQEISEIVGGADALK